jgi:hypothetical protein
VQRRDHDVDTSKNRAGSQPDRKGSHMSYLEGPISPALKKVRGLSFPITADISTSIEIKSCTS